jgi:SnoaL-like domain
MRSNSPQRLISDALKGLLDEFFGSVSFARGQTPAYARIREVFIEAGMLINNTAEHPEILTVDAFIASRQAMFDSGALIAFEEVETDATTEVFGSVAHRFSTYEKRGWVHGQALAARGRISTQFVRTPSGWKMSSMAWDDER